MKIHSINNESWLSIENILDEHGYGSVSIEAEVDIGHSFFHGKNADIYFTNLDDFIIQLDAFISNRDISPKLEGTYDSYISLKGSQNVILNFNIGSAFCGSNEAQYFCTKGSFELPQEYLNEILAKFKLLASNA